MCSIGGMTMTGENSVIGENPDPVPLSSPYILHGLARGLNGRLGEWPATCRLSSGTAFEDCVCWKLCMKM